MVDKKRVPKDLYDIQKLFPSQIATIYNQKDRTQLSAESQRWLSKSAFTVGTVGLLSKFWLTCKSIFDLELF